MRLRIPLWQRLFIAFAGLSIAALATFAFLQQQDLRRGFLDYLNRLSMERISDGAARLGQRYDATGNWDFVRGRPDELMRILGLPPPPPRRPAFEDRNGGGGAFLQMPPRPPPGGPMRGRPPPPGPNGFPPPPGQRPPFSPNNPPPGDAPPFAPPDGPRPPMPEDGGRPPGPQDGPRPPPPDAVVPVAIDTRSDAGTQNASAASQAYVPPRETAAGDASSSTSSTPSAANANTSEVANVPAPSPPPPRDFGPPPPRPAGPLDLSARLLLVDASDEAVVGNPDVPADAPSVPVLSKGVIVGRLLLAPMPQLRGGLDLSFEQTQLHHAMGMAMGVLIGALLLSWQLARWLLAPVRALGQGARALVRGNYATRVPVTRSDELGALAEDFNLLAATLERNRNARQQWGADIAHELRTPIAILRGEIQALQDGIRQPGPETLASLHAECDRLAGLVDDLYQLALSDAGALVYRLEVLDLGELLRDLAHQHAGAMDDAGLDFELALPERTSLPVRVDAQRMMQLFGNLLRNAIRYTNAPGRVRIAVRRVGNDLFIDIDDTAPGVPPEALPHLFDRLYRVDPSRSRRSGGAGLGLAICRNIALAHGGHIVAAASGMGGVCITLRLPVAGMSA